MVTLRFCLIVAAALASGCTQVRQTDPAHTATELYLLSTAVENAVRPLSAPSLRGRLIYVDSRFVTEAQQQYLVAATRAKLLTEGARLTEHRPDAEIIVEVRTPGVSIDRSEFLVGIPNLPVGQIASTVGVPPTTLVTPELALIKSTKQWGTAGVAIVAYWRDQGQIVGSSGPHIGRSYREDWYFFGSRQTLSDIPSADPPYEAGVGGEGADATDDEAVEPARDREAATVEESCLKTERE